MEKNGHDENTAKTDENINTQAKKKNKTGKIIGFLILSVVLGAIIFLGIYIYQALAQPGSLFYASSGETVLIPKPMVENIDNGTPSVPVAPAQTSEQYKSGSVVNILLLGLDQDYKEYAPDGGDFHTDAIIVLAINFDKNTVDMISLPRDTFTHVPGIKGIYKLNAAINCGGGKTDAGFRKVCEAASWMLGGINIDYYYAFELDTVKEIGDLIGGVDFDVDMAYQGPSGTYYKKGMQHLDGTGIYDYMRVRQAATVGGHTDAGRMTRCKAMLKAIFEKLKTNNMLTEIPSLLSTINSGLYTNVSLQQSIALANYGYNKVDLNNVRLATMAGSIRSAIGWNFYFIDQDERSKLIKEVYGINVQPQEYVSYKYAEWLGNYGFDTIHYLGVVQELLEYIKTAGDAMSQDQQYSLSALKDAYNKAQTAFNAAALSLDSNDNEKMEAASGDLRQLTEKFAKSIGYQNKLSWSVVSPWCKDPYINEIDVNFQ